MTLMLESMGVKEQVSTLERLAGRLRDIVEKNGGSMDRDAALEAGALVSEIPISQMRYVLTFALSTDQIKQDRVEAVLSI